LPILPIRHSKGTAHPELTRGYVSAIEATSTAMLALMDTAPRGCDYYPVDGLYQKAEEEHKARVRKIREVLDELTTIAQCVR
jgi:hypothetical protein